MREFKCSFDGEIVDLDNSKIYDYLPNTIKELRQLMFSEIGYVYCYTNFWHSNLFNNNKFGGKKQKNNINKLIKIFTENEPKNYDNILWYKEQIFLFQNETENMC